MYTKPKGKQHLDKEFLEELKHKIWSTKGSRFMASQRMKTKARISTLTISILSAYLIVFSLISVYNINVEEKIPQNYIAFIITSLSIFLLVFSLFESTKEYSNRSMQYHNCALELAKHYNELQIFKTYHKFATSSMKLEFAKTIHCEYQKTLEKYENHLPMDNMKFRLDNQDYYDIKWYQPFTIPLSFYWDIYGVYTMLIVAPIGLLAYLLLCI